MRYSTRPPSGAGSREAGLIPRLRRTGGKEGTKFAARSSQLADPDRLADQTQPQTALFRRNT
jgi:hypothetical protein